MHRLSLKNLSLTGSLFTHLPMLAWASFATAIILIFYIPSEAIAKQQDFLIYQSRTYPKFNIQYPSRWQIIEYKQGDGVMFKVLPSGQSNMSLTFNVTVQPRKNPLPYCRTYFIVSCNMYLIQSINTMMTCYAVPIMSNIN